VLCVRSFSLTPPFTIFQHYLAPVPPAISTLLSPLYFLSYFSSQTEPLYTRRTQRRRGIYRLTSMYIGAMQEKGVSTTRMYLRNMYSDNLSFLLVHPICRSIDLSVSLYRASLRDDKFQLTLINFLLCHHRSNFCHIKAWYNKVKDTYACVYTHMYVLNIYTHIYMYIYTYTYEIEIYIPCIFTPQDILLQ